MSKQLTIEISQETQKSIKDMADAAGLSMAEWIADLVERQISPSEEKTSSLELSELHREKAWHKLMSHAGSISDIGNVDNDSIDADLAKAYANEL